MNKIFTLFRLVGIYKNISKFNNVNSRYHKKAKAVLQKLLADFDTDSVDQFPSNGKLKMQWYMAEFIYTCEVYNNVLGQKSTAKQREVYLLSGALIAMCDMIIDDIEMDDAKINKLKNPNSEFEGGDEIEQLYSIVYHAFFNSVPKHLKERTIDYYELLFDAQVESKKQFNSKLTKNEVDIICKDKCGYSMLFLRAIVEGDIDDLEKEAWYETGGFIQFCNDAQDLHKDLQKDMITFASARNSLVNIVDDIEKQKNIAFSLLKKTNYKDHKKDNLLLTLYVMHLGILAKLTIFDRICNLNFSLENLKTKEKDYVRSRTSEWNIFRFVLPRVVKYNYESIDVFRDSKK